MRRDEVRSDDITKDGRDCDLVGVGVRIRRRSRA